MSGGICPGGCPVGRYKQVLGVCQNFSARGRPGGRRAPNVNLGPPIISETTRARKLKLKAQLDVVKYSLRVQKFSTMWRPGGAARRAP